MAHEKKTNAARILDRLGIKYELISYPVDPDNLAADHVADELGEPVEKVYKTLVLRGDRTGLIVCVIAGNREVDLKKAAAASGNKRCEMLPLKELLPATSYIRGGCTALGMKKPYPVFVSDEMPHHSDIFVSAGVRGMQIHLSPADYIRAVDATTADITSSTTDAPRR